MEVHCQGTGSLGRVSADLIRMDAEFIETHYRGTGRRMKECINSDGLILILKNDGQNPHWQEFVRSQMSTETEASLLRSNLFSKVYDH